MAGRTPRSLTFSPYLSPAVLVLRQRVRVQPSDAGRGGAHLQRDARAHPVHGGAASSLTPHRAHTPVTRSLLTLFASRLSRPRGSRGSRGSRILAALAPQPFQILKYEVGQFYRQHHDQNSGLFTPQGVRVYTFFMYLSTPEAGGATKFNNLNMQVPAIKGNAVLWPSVTSDDPTRDEPKTNHEALPVEAGQKFASNVWVHMYEYAGAGLVPSTSARHASQRVCAHASY